MTSLSERQQLITLIDQATDKGARLHIATFRHVSGVAAREPLAIYVLF